MDEEGKKREEFYMYSTLTIHSCSILVRWAGKVFLPWGVYHASELAMSYTGIE